MKNSSQRIVRVRAPSRLHFGLLSFGNVRSRQFGGVGVMINRPSLRLQVSASSDLVVAGPCADRVREFAIRWATFHERSSPPACAIHVLDVPRQHAGLGSGTQLALATAAGLNAFFDMPPCSPAELAISVGRGTRSAVGTYGFAGGGLIAEQGKLPGEPVAPLDCRVDMPNEWRFVVVCPAGAGLSGAPEEAAFDQLPAVPERVTSELAAIIGDGLFPAATMRDFDAFSDSLYRYGRMAGSCFAAQQGGPYNGPRLTEIVDTIRSLGVHGLGQSSWGPTLFALTRSDDEAHGLLGQLTARFTFGEDEIWAAAPENRGAVVKVEEQD